MTKVYIGLVHYPIYNKNYKIIATAITNYDIHDIARTSRTYGIKNYYIIHPLDSQAELAKEIIAYWQEGYGKTYNPDRADALAILKIRSDIEEVKNDIAAIEGKMPIIVTTDARTYPNTISYVVMRQKIEQDDTPVLLLFGTGWGIQKEVMQSFDYILEPIYGPCDYNHLCVRSAVAIILDRLLGEKWWSQ